METEILKEKQETASPFIPLPKVVETTMVLNDVDSFNQLKLTARVVAKHAIMNLKAMQEETTLDIEKIAVLEYGTYTKATALAVRRGIKELLANRVIAKKGKATYWVNQDIIWKKERR